MSIEPGRRMLHYTLTEKIGERGMGTVWRATDTTLNRDVSTRPVITGASSAPRSIRWPATRCT